MHFRRRLMLLFSPTILAVGMITLAKAQSTPPMDAVDEVQKGEHFVPVRTVEPRSLSLGVPLTTLFPNGGRVETPPIDELTLLEEDRQAGPGPLRMGVVQEFTAESESHGVWTATADGGWLWTLALRAPDAKALRVRVRDWDPPVGAALVLFNPGLPAESIGPFTAIYPTKRLEFWTPTVYAADVNLEYYLPPGVSRESPKAHLVVTGIVHQYLAAAEGDRGGPLPCHLDQNCYSAWTTTADGVAALSYVSNQFAYFCSGGLLNRVPGDLTSLFMTARHCGVDDANASSLLVTWFYESTSCGSGTIVTGPQSMGVTVLVSDPGTDWCLVGLREDVPNGVTYLGWDTSSWSNGSDATSIHHPRGSFKRIAFGEKVQNVTSCVSGSAALVRWPDNSGLLEPGSSGSPVFDASHRVRGTDSCGNASCDNASEDQFGRLDVAYPGLLEDWLHPADPVYVDGSYFGSEEGTVTQPFNTLVKGFFAVIRSSDLYLESGSYDEPMVLEKAMTIHARNGVVTIGQ